MRLKKVIDSFNNAIDGIIYTVRTQRNMKIHMSITLIVLLLCLCFDISKIEFLILAITITMVIAAELLNTSIEAVVDMKTNHYHPLAKVSKNVAAGAVLLTAINAVVVGYIIFWDKLSNISLIVLNKIKESQPHTIFIVLVIVCIVTIIIKSIFGEGTPLKGGMPSGHSALAFSLFMAISLITEEPICIMLSFIMAIITAQSRVDSDVHSTFEVVVGSLIGILTTLLIFTIFKI